MNSLQTTCRFSPMIRCYQVDWKVIIKKKQIADCFSFFFTKQIFFRGLVGHLSVAKLSRERFIHFDKCLHNNWWNTQQKTFSFSRKKKNRRRNKRTSYMYSFFKNIVVYSASAIQPNCLFPLSLFLMFAHKNGGTNIRSFTFPHRQLARYICSYRQRQYVRFTFPVRLHGLCKQRTDTQWCLILDVRMMLSR